MAQYIDKSALVAEIERLKSVFVNERDDFEKGYHYSLNLFISFLDTLEVKEVNLEDDVDKILEANDWNFDKIDFYQFAKHFFELGMVVSNKIYVAAE